MDAETLFTLCGRLVLPAWLLLIVAPKWAWTSKLISHAWIPALLAIAYIYCMIAAQPSPAGGGFGSLQEVMILFTSPYLALAGWIHYLAFDLFIGAWQVRDAQRRGVNHFAVIPCLILTFLAGPVGLLLYFIVRFVTARTLTTVEVLEISN
ncbi:MAG: hypothetical protein ACI9FR_000519 [Cryomorphaceae bacterium]|jgi:hypothetical protein